MIPFRTYDTYQPFGLPKVPPKTLHRRTLTGPFRSYGRQPAMSVRPQNGEFSYVALIADYIAVKTEAYRSVVELASIYADRARRDGLPCGKSVVNCQKPLCPHTVSPKTPRTGTNCRH
ncbi:hypothetical protein HDG33_006304 [Paraburkholderia sp. Cpub6]|nr:hypothetical protein [Paraburkholderia sp. Cpub6]